MWGGSEVTIVAPTSAEAEHLTGQTVAILAGTATDQAGQRVEISAQKKHTYKLRVGIPRQLKTAHLPEDLEGMEEECAKQFFVTNEALLAAIAAKVSVHERTVEVFTQAVQLELFQAAMDPAEIARRAMEMLTKNEGFHAKELKQYLREQLTKQLTNMGLGHLTEPATLNELLNMLIIRDKGALLREAQKKALANHAVVELAGELPEAFTTDEACKASLRNVYNVYPPNMNNWERAFAEYLDHTVGSTVQWWHRNNMKEPWSVSMVRADGKHFYPDFVVALEGRKTENGILLVDPKAMFEDSNQVPKILAEHPAYGRALIVYKVGASSWLPVIWDTKNSKAATGGELDVSRMVQW